MEIFLSLALELVPLYFLIVIGFIAGRWLGVDKRSVATLAIYTVTPVVIMYGVSRTEITPSFIAIPVIMFSLCAFICFFFAYLGKRGSDPKMAGILGFSAASGNTGYFGIPVALLVFGDEALGPAAVAVLGTSCFENTLGVYAMASGKHTPKDALKTLLKLPPLYGFFIGLCLNLGEVSYSSSIEEMFQRFVGAYTVLGMMIIGLGLSSMAKASFDWKFTAVVSFAHYCFWPALVSTCIALDKLFIGALTELSQSVLLFMSIVPMGANTVAWATVFDLRPDRVALAVLLTTLFALIYIPLFVGWFIL